MAIVFKVSDELPDHVPAVVGHQGADSLVLVNYTACAGLDQQERLDILSALFAGREQSTPKDCADELREYRERRQASVQQTG